MNCGVFPVLLGPKTEYLLIRDIKCINISRKSGYANPKKHQTVFLIYAILIIYKVRE